MDVKRIILFASLILVVSTIAMAEPSGHLESISSKAGPWALLFGVTKNFSLAPFAGTEFWIQRGLPSGDALRVGAGVGFGSTGGANYGDIDRDSIDVSVAVHYVHYVSMDGDLSFLFGAGPIVRIGSWSAHESQRVDQDTLVYVRERRTEEDSWSAGVEVLVGAEWQLTRHIAVSGDYSSAVVYSSKERDTVWRDRKNDEPWEIYRDEHPHLHGWSTGDLIVRLGLTIYL